MERKHHDAILLDSENWVPFFSRSGFEAGEGIPVPRFSPSRGVHGPWRVSLVSLVSGAPEAIITAGCIGLIKVFAKKIIITAEKNPRCSLNNFSLDNYRMGLVLELVNLIL